MKILVVIDTQQDFMTGVLGNEQTKAVIPHIVEKINNTDADLIICTRDTHGSDYMGTREGKRLPILHCQKGTAGWQFVPEIQEALDNSPKNVKYIDKPVFGSPYLATTIHHLTMNTESTVEIIGVDTDICVISNAMIIKAECYDTCDVVVDSSCCAGVTPELHEAALAVMKSAHIDVI